MLFNFLCHVHRFELDAAAHHCSLQVTVDFPNFGVVV